MTLLNLQWSPALAQAYCRTNHIVGLALNLMPNGRAQACEIRRDEEGEYRTPLAEMTTADFYTLANRLGIEIMEGKDASKEEIAATRLQMRRGMADEYLPEGESSQGGRDAE
jgi:hypothetical protein